MNQLNSLAKRIIAAVAAGTLLITIPLSGCNNTNDGKDNKDEGSKTSQTAEQASGGQSDSNAVASSEHYSIPFAVFNYLYNYNYQSFTSTYGTEMMDTSKSLSEQYYDEENKITWHDYFVQSTQDYISYIMCFAEAAKEHGLELSDEDEKSIEDGFASYEEVAKQNSQTLDEYFKSIYGTAITQDDIKNIQMLSKLGLKYRDQLNDSYTFTDKDYEDKFAENKTNYQVADFYIYNFNYTEPNSDGTSMVVNEDTKNKMKENADALSNCKNSKEFKDYLTKFLKSNPSLVSVDSAQGESSITEESFNSAVNEAVEATYHAKMAYDNSSDIAKWIYDEARKAGDTNVVESETNYTVVLIEKPLYRDESATRNVRHILITTDSITSGETSGESSSADVTDEQLKAKAEEIYKDWSSKDTTEQRFAELANQYSTDPGSNTNGGLYTNVQEGQMVPAFNDWLFDKNRKPGDSGIVHTTYGYHIMYYVGTGLKSWQINVESVLKEAKLAADYELMKKKYTITFDTEAIKKVELDKKEESSSNAANLANQ